MISPRLCLVSGADAPVTACLLGQILSGRGRTGLAALSPGFEGEPEDILRQMAAMDCDFAVAALPERLARRWTRGAETAVILSRGTGEAAAGLTRRCRNAILNLDDPEGPVRPPDPVRVWTISERRDDADLTAKNLRVLPFRTEFEAVTRDHICRLSVPMPDGRGLYPGLAAACAALTFGVGVGESARRLRAAQPVPSGMIPLEGVGPLAAAGYFESETKRVQEI